MFKTIVLATDGSTCGDAAVDGARSMLGFGFTDVVVVHVIELVGGKDGIVPLAADEDDLRAKISRQVEQLKLTESVPKRLSGKYASMVRRTSSATWPNRSTQT
ncbi:MAG: hypothetical protein M3N95_00355 [Actinomycetota bacterium]|nr:hypothetical protein [Actinomycetota bacterium]